MKINRKTVDTMWHIVLSLQVVIILLLTYFFIRGLPSDFIGQPYGTQIYNLSYLGKAGSRYYFQNSNDKQHIYYLRGNQHVNYYSDLQKMAPIKPKKYYANFISNQLGPNSRLSVKSTDFRNIKINLPLKQKYKVYQKKYKNRYKEQALEKIVYPGDVNQQFNRIHGIFEKWFLWICMPISSLLCILAYILDHLDKKLRAREKEVIGHERIVNE